MKEKIIIPIQTEKERFLKHIENPFNSSIFFSGIFGIGKTYFLKDFFNSYLDKFDTYFISPINYSIAQNKDIFKYIKFDIAYELLNKQVDFNDDNFSLSQTLPFFVKNNKLEILKIILKNAGKLGKGIKDLVEFFEKALEQNKALNKGERQEIIDYLKSVSQIDGSLYEDDIITSLLSEKIESHKNKENHKKAVLIIDDLDRLDPAHIFRILNILAHQVDIENSKNNLFSFDKIIIVGDVNNIRNIFHSKYGDNTDFSGYIDKFFDNEVYYFDNKKYIINQLDEILGNIKLGKQSEKIINLKNHNNTKYLLLKEMILNLIQNDLLNLRSLLKYEEQTFEFENYKFNLKGWSNYSCSCEFVLIVLFEFLLKLYGEISALKIAIQKIVNQHFELAEDLSKTWFGFLLPLINYKNIEKYQTEGYSYFNSSLNIEIKYKMERWGSDIRIYFANIYEIVIDKKNINFENTSFNDEKFNYIFRYLLKIAFEKYLETKNNKF